MAYQQNTLQRAASCYGSVSILDGVKFKVGEKFKPPKKVTLPVGWHQNDPSEVLNLTYDFKLEKDVLAKCETERLAKEMESARLKEEEFLKAAMTVSTSSTCMNTESTVQPFSNSNATLLYANVSTDILTPVTATSTNFLNSNRNLARADSFNIKDFESDLMTPFDLVELQTINDMDALKSVLQPELGSAPTSSPSPVATNANTISSVASEQLVNINNTSANVNFSTQTSASCHRTANVAKFPSHLSHVAENINGTTSQNIAQPSVAPLFGQGSTPKTHPSISYSAGHNNVLIDVGDNKPLFQPVPLSTSPSALTGQQPGVLPGCPVSRVDHLPPIVGTGSGKLPPLRPVPPQIPPRTYKQAVSNQNGGVHAPGQDVTTAITPTPPGSSSETSICRETMRNNHSPEPVPRGYTPPTLGQENVAVNSYCQNTPETARRKTADRRIRMSSFDGVDTQGTDMRRHSSPLPPIHNASNDTIYPGAPVSCLPDPLPTMSESEKSFVASISNMGFPSARVARGVLKLGKKEREVIDFLILVEEFSASGYLNDSIEIALLEYDMDREKALKFLKAASQLGELGFNNEDIREALKQNSLDTDKALDCLMAK